MINRNFSELELGYQKGELSDSETVAEGLLFFPGKDPENKMSQTLHKFLFPSIKMFSFICCVGTCT